MAKMPTTLRQKSNIQNKLQTLVKKIKSNSKASISLVAVMVLASSVIGYYQTSTATASTITQTQCANQGGVWLDLRSHGVEHGPCWSTPGAYLVNYGAGKTGDGIDQVSSGESERMAYPNYMIIVSGTWHVCDDKWGSDPCSYPKKKGAYNLCNYMKEAIDGYDIKFCSKSDVYIDSMFN